MLKVVILISGNGSNLQAIIDYIQQRRLPISIEAVISNRADAFGLTRASQADIPTQVLEHQRYADRAEYDQALQDCLTRYQPDLIVLAGFMRILGPALVNAFHDRIINIHPALLPKFPGLHTYRQALAAGETVHGTTVHFVTETVDAGPIIAQSSFPITPPDTEETLQARTQTLEHELYPKVIEWYAKGLFQLEKNTVIWHNDEKSL
jgi:phosphoribosylglycinamide formyltransferase-1